MREIVLDTETTGLDPKSGHKIVEIGCVELENHLPTGQTFHRYLNPERDMPDGAFQVHGLSEEFLADYPVFAAEADAFLDFIGDSPLVIHNAEFDMRFLNWELQILGYPLLPMERAIDTVAMARKKFPGSPANLDALCRRFDIDNAAREKHGALLDAELLAEVYLELIGGREPGLALASRRKAADMARLGENKTKETRIARPHAPTSDEALSWEKFVEKINDPIWKQ